MPKKYLSVAGIWFFDPVAPVSNRCRGCKYIASQQIPSMEMVNGLAGILTTLEPENSLPCKKFTTKKVEQIDWYLHLNLTPSVNGNTLVAKSHQGKTEHSIPFKPLIEFGLLERKIIPTGISSSSDKESFVMQWFNDGMRQLKDLNIVRSLLAQKFYASGCRVRVRRGFPSRKEYSAFEPDKPKGKVQLIKSVSNISDNRGVQIVVLSDGSIVPSQYIHLIPKRKKETLFRVNDAQPSSWKIRWDVDANTAIP